MPGEAAQTYFGKSIESLNLPEAGIGDYVLVHVGFAISQIDEEEAARTYQYLAEMDQLAELNESEP